MIEVIFKKDTKSNEIIAFMPYDFCDWQGNFTCYAHIGQHSSSSYEYYSKCKIAKKEEYSSLLEELKNIGYNNIKIINRINGKKFKDAYQDFLTKDRVLRNVK